MQSVPLSPAFFEGALSVEEGDGWLKPWRLPHPQHHLFPSPDNGLLVPAETASCVRLRFATDSNRLALTFLPLGEVPPACERELFQLDATINGELAASACVPPAGERAVFEKFPSGPKVVELWLPAEVPIAIRELLVDDGTQCELVEDPRPRWVTYGSSLTHCVRANSSARTWPAIVARRHELNLTSLGFGGHCHLEPMVALTIRDLPADLITLKLGINCIGGSLGARTFPAAVLGLVKIIREKHPTTPIALVSPIGYPPHETTPNIVGYTISAMRADIQDVFGRLVQDGDRHLACFNGLDVFDLQLIARYTTDECHPNGDGIELMAENFDRAVMKPMLARIQGE